MNQLQIIVTGNTALIPVGITKKSVADFCRSSHCCLQRKDTSNGILITRNPSKEKVKLSTQELFWELGEHYNNVAVVKETEN